MYHPLLVFDGETGQLITAVLRPGTVHAGHGARAILQRIVGRLRERWPGVAISLRADAGFARHELYAFCEVARVVYTIGLVTNPRLTALAAPVLAETLAASAQADGAKVRRVTETVYQADSWPAPRGVLIKTEALARGPNTRFVVTNRPEEPAALYDAYVDRGETENWIKDLKRACLADRLSCHRFLANQVRLLHAAAYALLHTLRTWLVAAGAKRLTLENLRLRLLKIGGSLAFFFDGWNAQECAVAAESGFVCIDLYHAFNSPDGISPAGDLLERDHSHPSRKGNGSLTTS